MRFFGGLVGYHMMTKTEKTISLFPKAPDEGMLPCLFLFIYLLHRYIEYVIPIRSISSLCFTACWRLLLSLINLCKLVCCIACCHETMLVRVCHFLARSGGLGGVEGIDFFSSQMIIIIKNQTIINPYGWNNNKKILTFGCYVTVRFLWVRRWRFRDWNHVVYPQV